MLINKILSYTDEFYVYPFQTILTFRQRQPRPGGGGRGVHKHIPKVGLMPTAYEQGLVVRGRTFMATYDMYDRRINHIYKLQNRTGIYRQERLKKNYISCLWVGICVSFMKVLDLTKAQQQFFLINELISLCCNNNEERNSDKVHISVHRYM